MTELEVVPVDKTERERAALRRSRSVARLLDESVRIPGTQRRVGLDAMLGLLPLGGDAIGALLSLYVVVEAYRIDAPNTLILRMLVNVLVDFVGGIVPIVGDAFDAVWKANSRNVDLLESYVEDG